MEVIGTAGNDTLLGSDGNDTIYGGGGSDELNGAAGHDVLFAGGGSDTLSGGAGSDWLDGGDDSDLLEGGAGSDHLEGGAGSDTYLFSRGWGSDTIYGPGSFSGEVDTVLFSAGISAGEILVYRKNDDLYLELADGVNTIKVANYFQGDGCALIQVRFDDGVVWSSVDILSMVKPHPGQMIFGDNADNVIHGNDGHDTIDGQGGNDSLYGDSGNDWLNGWTGNDVLIGGAGDDLLGGNDGDDIYIFGLGDGRDIIFNAELAHAPDDPSYVRGEDTLQFSSGVRPEDVVLSRGPISYLGEVLNGDTHLTLAIKGTDDQISIINYFGNSEPDYGFDYSLKFIKFENGTIWTMTDVLAWFAAHNDQVINGDAGDNSLAGGLGNDTINGLDGADELSGGDGNDQLFGGAGNDTLNGGAGNDSLQGGSGSDVYYFSRGWGQDTIHNYDSGTGKVDAITFATDIAPSDVVITRSGFDLVLSLLGTTDKVTVYEHFTYDGNGAYELEEIRFANGTTWTVEQVKLMVLQGTAGNDTLTGYATNDSISAGLGDDHLYGGSGDDSLLGGEGADSLYGEGGNDLLLGGAGNDNLDGGAGNDTFDGGAGNDTYWGGLGDDTFVVDSSADIIFEFDSQGTDTVESSVSLTLSGNLENLTLTGTAAYGAGNALNNRLLGNAANNRLSGGAGNDNLDGGDGSDTLDGGLGNDTLNGGAGNDTYLVDSSLDVIVETSTRVSEIDSVQSSVSWALGANLEKLTLTGAAVINATGNSLNNSLTGNSAANVLDGGAGNDTLNGGAGNDSLQGGSGSDVYHFSRGWGQDTINNYDTSTGKVDAITFAAGIAPSDLLITRSANDLFLSLAGTTDKVTVPRYFDADGTSAYKLEEIRFADGTTWTVKQVKLLALQGTAGNDRLIGYETNDSISGGLGDDTLNGKGGDDILDGGAGNDTMWGLSGDDLLNGGAGNDVMHGDDSGPQYQSVWTVGNDTLNGEDGDDRLYGGLGADYLSGGAGNDVLFGQNGDEWQQGDDSDTLLGGEGADSLYGEGGNDLLQGDAGNDRLDGGAGSDTLTGGTGNDTYLLGRGYGADTVVENDVTAGNTDVAQFLSGIATDQLWFSQAAGSNNLDVSVIGTADKLIIKDWYVGSANHVEQLKTSDGKTLLDSNVQNLVSAMAAFAPPAPGQTSLSAIQHAALDAVIAANWQ